MSRIECILVAFTAALTGTLFSQATPKLVGFPALLANPQAYLGQTIALYGVIDQSEAAIGGFRLIEVKWSGTQAKDQASSLQATWANGATRAPVQNGQDVVAIGQIQMQAKAPILHLANIITDKDAIRGFVRPSERRPRPGDNLGHDAQPSKSISD
jgi:hypothetical protein